MYFIKILKYFCSRLFSTVILISLSFFSSARGMPVIVITDLYVPCQDVGDNFDIITPYALPEIDLKGVIFDVTESFRKENTIHGSAREPGFIAIHQLNYIFNRNVPAACAPFSKMRFPTDKMEDIPSFQQQGINLFFEILKHSKEKVEVVSTGSTRALAVAYNRNPQLMKDKINRIHICAGASSDKYREWNVDLDTIAFYRMLSSDLPVCIYPCATENGPFDLGENNSFWALDNMSFILDMDPKLQSYLAYTFDQKNRSLSKDNSLINSLDFLQVLDRPITEDQKNEILNYDAGKLYGPGGKHYVWETALWLNIANLRLVKKSNGQIRIVREKEIQVGDIAYDEKLIPCKVNCDKNGLFTFNYTKQKTNFSIYSRANPKKNEEWLCKAFPEFYKSFNINPVK